MFRHQLTQQAARSRQVLAGARKASVAQAVRLSPCAPASVPLQRSVGNIDMVFSRVEAASRVTRCFQQGAMKTRFPRAGYGEPPEAVLINTSGGLTGGDRQNVSVNLEAQAEAVITTQACERVYRSSGDDAAVNVHLAIGANANLHWLPQPLIFFDGGRLKRETHVELSSDATLLAVESVIFGRLESGEAVKSGALSDAWFVRRAGRLIHAERFAADGAIDATLDKAPVLAGTRAMALIRYIAPDAEARLVEMRELLAGAAIEAAASAWNGMLLVRSIASGGYELNRELVRVLSAFRAAALPKAWLL